MPFPYPPTPIGTGPKFHPPAQTRPVPLSCAKTKRYGVHLELFARNRVIIVPAGIEHRCLRTRWPVGIVEVRGRHTLGEFFRVWGQPLSQTRLVGFKTRPDRPVRAYVNGRRWRGELCGGSRSDGTPTSSSSSAGTFGRTRSSSSRSACEARPPHRPSRRRARGLLAAAARPRRRSRSRRPTSTSSSTSRRRPASRPGSRPRSASPSSSRPGSR